MMNEKHISLLIAKLLLEKGFNEYTCGTFTEYTKTQKDPEYPNGGGPFSMTKGEIEFENGYFRNSSFDRKNKSYQIYSAPTQTIVQKWLREKYHLYIRVVTTSITTHFPMIELAEVDGTHLRGPAYDKNYETYEDALEVGLEEALKLI